jgi:hypothetical protein
LELKGDESALFELKTQLPHINPTILQTLKSHAKENFEKLSLLPSSSLSDLKLELSPALLTTLVGEPAFQTLLSSFNCIPCEIFLRRCISIGSFINFYTDHSLKTL